jgi:hypothetical protein
MLPLLPPEEEGRKFLRNLSIYHSKSHHIPYMKLLPLTAVSIATCYATHSNVTINFTCSNVQDTRYICSIPDGVTGIFH